MTTIRILLAPTAVMGNMYFLSDDSQKRVMIETSLPQYLILPPITLDPDLVGNPPTGISAASEAFDLTNNPARQEERMARYGNGRSLSPGDIVQVGEEMWACMSFGWMKLSDECVYITTREY